MERKKKKKRIMECFSDEEVFVLLGGGGYGEWARNYHCPWLSARRNPNCTLNSVLRTCMFNAKSS